VPFCTWCRPGFPRDVEVELMWFNPPKGLRAQTHSFRYIMLTEGFETFDRALHDQIMQHMGNEGVWRMVWNEMELII
jgi:hypothetical protein